MPSKRKRATNNVTSDKYDHPCSDDDALKKKVRWEGMSRTTVEDSDGDEGDEDSSIIEKTCLAAFCTHGRVGFAYYQPVNGLLQVLEDTQDSAHLDLTRMLLEQANPDVVLTSSKSEDEFIDTLRDHVDAAGGIFQIRPFKEFIASRGRERLLSLKCLSELPMQMDDRQNSSDIGNTSSRANNAYDFMRHRQAINGDPTAQRWNAAIRLANFSSTESSPLCMASIGAILDHLVRERAAGDFDDDGLSGLDIRDIQTLSLDQIMQINADALQSLQVFENESHASVHSDRTKEGLSLFGILNGTKTTLGRALLRTWLLRPSLSLSKINERHEAVACFIRPDNLAAANLMHSHLKGIKNMPRVLTALHSGRAKLSDWQGFVKFAFHTTMLRDTLTEVQQTRDVEVVKKLTSALDIATFKDIGSRVNDTIDWEESTTADRVCVRAHIDEDLDNRKHVYHGIDSILSTVAEQISQNVSPKVASTLNVVYFPQLGYLICVPMLKAWQTAEGMKLPVDGWIFQFSSDAHVYFKSQEMRDMDIHVGDLHSAIVDRELEIIQDLLEEVLVYNEAMMKACDVCAELDCLLSFAEASQLNDYKRPDMVDDNIIEICQGRHPLYEHVLDTFVPNDARLRGGVGISASQNMADDRDQGSSVILCTGANACGKSVYMKQIALIQIMAQIGCFVPAESAILGIVDKIFTRIATRESVSKAQSAFMIDLNQVSLALRNCTARSLILLDEFGKGTLSSDGAGLFCGVVQHLLNRGINCPKILIATHFHDVFKQDILDPEILPISFRHMQVMFTSSGGATIDMKNDNAGLNEQESRAMSKIGPGEKITYLYRVVEGLSLGSHAASCAAIFGIPARIVERAQYVSNLISAHEIGQLLDEEMSEEEREDLRDAEAVCRRFLEWDLSDSEGVNVKEKLRCVLGKEDLEEDESL